METIFSEKATSIYVKFDNRDDFSKISIGADFSGEIGPKRFGADFSRGRFIQGPIYPAFFCTAIDYTDKRTTLRTEQARTTSNPNNCISTGMLTFKDF